MKWFSIQTAVVALLFTCLGAAGAIVVQVPPDAQPSDYLSLYGSLVGSFFAVLAAVLVIWLQFAEQEARRANTLRVLIEEVRRNGISLQFYAERIEEPGRIDEINFTARHARRSFEAARNVARALQIEGPNFARVALVFEKHDSVLKMLDEVGDVSEAIDDWRPMSASTLLKFVAQQAAAALNDRK